MSSGIDGYSPSKAEFARFLTRSLALKEREALERIEKKIPALPKPNLSDEVPGQFKLSHKQSDPVNKGDLSIGIIGAGISGLYTALLLKTVGIKYEILEANPHRIGGRLCTHYFGEQRDGTHQYYDIGAMRFPKTPIMARTFHLFDYLGMTEKSGELGEYIMMSENQPMRYNDITKVLPQDKKWEHDHFRVSTASGGPVPVDTVRNPDEILNDAYFPYRRKIKRALDAVISHETASDKDKETTAWKERLEHLIGDLERAWRYLMQHDKFSLRDYLSFVEGLDDASIHWLETLNAGTGWFDEAFSENVMESLAFEYNNSSDAEPMPMLDLREAGKKVDWRYITNGSYKLTEKTADKIDRKNIKMDQLVTSMNLINISKKDNEQDSENDLNMGERIQVTVRNEIEPKIYDTVFCSTTFAAMQKMDLTGLNLNYNTKAAIRSLRYDPSTKVAIQFKSAWWIKSNSSKGLTGIKGGLGKTDMPLRTCVYPSYNIDDVDTKDKPAVLLCSYTWGQDSERIASMIDPVPTGGSPKAIDNSSKAKSETLLKETMIDNLARLHSVNDLDYKAMKDLITESYITHHSYDWSKDPYTCGGAFALYSPSQFRRMYPHVVKPLAGSRFHIIGEAASTHHAWVVGALDSAARGVYMMLTRFGLIQERKDLERLFGKIGEVDPSTAEIQIMLGMLQTDDPSTVDPPALT